MTALYAGFEIVCPDGRVRHLPYHNRGDAECDAGEFTRIGCLGHAEEPSRLMACQPACPEGVHEVRAARFTHPEHEAGAEA